MEGIEISIIQFVFGAFVLLDTLLDPSLATIKVKYADSMYILFTKLETGYCSPGDTSVWVLESSCNIRFGAIIPYPNNIFRIGNLR